MQNLEISLYNENVETRPNVANVETEIARLTVPVGDEYVLPRVFRPSVFKLFKANGQQIGRGSRISLHRQLPGQRQSEPIATFGYSTFYGLDEVNQAKDTNDRVMTKDLGFARNGRPVPGARFPQESQLIIKLESTDVVSMSHAKTAITFDVAER